MILRVLNTIFLGLCAVALSASLWMQYQQISMYNQQLKLLGSDNSATVEVAPEESQPDPYTYQKQDRAL